MRNLYSRYERKLIHASVFSTEIRDLKSKAGISDRNRLTSLNSFIDQDGISRVGSRLIKSNDNYDEKNSIILPSHDHVTNLIINHFHLLYHHMLYVANIGSSMVVMKFEKLFAVASRVSEMMPIR